MFSDIRQTTTTILTVNDRTIKQRFGGGEVKVCTDVTVIMLYVVRSVRGSVHLCGPDVSSSSSSHTVCGLQLSDDTRIEMSVSGLLSCC